MLPAILRRKHARRVAIAHDALECTDLKRKYEV